MNLFTVISDHLKIVATPSCIKYDLYFASVHVVLNIFLLKFPQHGPITGGKGGGRSNCPSLNISLFNILQPYQELEKQNF